VQEVTDGQLKPAADKIAKEAEPLADKANEQIMKGANILSDNVSHRSSQKFPDTLGTNTVSIVEILQNESAR